MSARAAAVGAAAAALAGGLLAPGAVASVLVVGDSLGVGTQAPLLVALPQVSFDSDSENGRTSPEGIAVLRERLRPEHEVVVFDLGTNDGPTAAETTLASFAAARDLAGGRCLVVATLNHPPVGGMPIAAQNTAIRRFVDQTPTAVLVDWHRTASSSPGLLRPDGVHPTPAGYSIRAQMLASEILGCLTGQAGPDAPRPGSSPSHTARPADRRSRTGRSGPPLEARLLAALGDRLAAPGGPLDLAAKAGGMVAATTKTARAALTPRGSEPVLGSPD